MRYFIFSIFCSFQCLGLLSQTNADFSFSKAEGCGTLQVQFTDLSSSPNQIVQWQWSLGGTTSDLQNPGKIFSQFGQHDICLTVTDNTGASDQKCIENAITVFALPTADFEGEPIVGCVPLTTKFGSKSESPNGSITNYIWGVGGSTSVLESAVDTPVFSTYLQPDSYSVSLTIEDEKGCSNTILKEDYVTAYGIRPVKLFSMDSVSCDNPHNADISILNPDPDVIYTWDLGNGQTATGNSASTIYNEFERFDITIFAENPIAGCRDTFYFESFITIGIDIKVRTNIPAACVGQRIAFYDESIIQDGDVLWEFGDGETSTKPISVHTYTEPGCYFPTLTKTVDGCVSSYTFENCFEVYDRPSSNILFDRKGDCNAPAAFNVTVENTNYTRYKYILDGSTLSTGTQNTFTFNLENEGVFPIEIHYREDNHCWGVSYDTLYVGQFFVQGAPKGIRGCAPLQIDDFSDYVSSPFNIVDWEWTLFTDPIQTWNTASPSTTIADTGVYDLQLIAADDQGCRDTFFFEKFVRSGVAPQVDFTADPLFACVDSVVDFNSIIDGSANEFYWDFGDGGISILSNPVHEYTDTGIFSVYLEAGHNGCFSQETKIDYIRILPPIAKFTFEVDCAESEVTFTNRSIGAETFLWDFGVDGTNTDVSSEEHPTFQFPGVGIYPVTLLVTNAITGCTDDLVINVDLRGIDVSFQVDSSEACIPFALEVNGEGSDIAHWKWAAPGAQILDDTSQSTKLTYKNSGKFPFIRLIGVSNAGCLDTFIYDDTITIHRAFAKFGVLPNLFCGKDSITLLDSSSSRFKDIVAWDWIVGDSLFIFNDEKPTFFLDTIGIFPVTLSVKDEFGCSAEAEIDSAITFFIPDPSFRNDTAQCPGLALSFNAEIIQPDVTYLWDFGDGQFAEGHSTTHTYQAEGNYTVCLTVTNGAACDSTFCKDQGIQIKSPMASFAADTTYANCPPLVVQFENTSVNANSYLWQFGDNSGISDLKEPGHVYTQPGVYDVTLVAMVSPQCIDTILLEDYIRIEGPEGDFSMVVDTTCAPLEVSFFGHSQDMYEYIWDFGDGQIDSSGVRVIADSTTYQYFNKGSYLPKLILIDSEDCLRSFAADDSIKVLESAGAYLTENLTICKGESATLNATLVDENLSLSYSWQANEYLDCETCLETEVKPDSTTIFYFSTTAINGCVFEDSVKVTVADLPTINVVLSKDTTVCFRDSLEILVTSTGINPSFLWASHEDINCDTCRSIAVTPDESTIYYVEVKDSIGCQNEELIEVEVAPEFIPFAPDDIVICEDDTAYISLDNLLSVQFLSPYEIACDTCLNTYIIPTHSDCVPMRGINPLGCALKDTFCVSVRSKRDLDAGEDQTICIGESVLLDALAFGNISWSPDMYLSHPEESATDATPDTTTQFVIKSEDGLCTLIDTVIINVKYKASIEAIGDTICVGDTAVVVIESDAMSIQLPDNWNQELIEIETEKFTVATEVKATGHFPIYGFLSTCEPDTADVFILVYDSVNFSLPDRILDYPNHPTTVEVDIQNPENYAFQWEPSELFDCPQCERTKVTLDSSQSLFINVMDTRTGCFKNDTITFRVAVSCKADEYIFIPNVFSPNGDGTNDHWQLYSDHHQEIYSLRIFDRWGTMVWSTTSFDAIWDGTFEGNPLPPGVYAYSLEGPCVIDNSDFVLKGNVTLLR